MDKASTYLGVLTDVQQKENKNGKYKTAWLESYTSKLIFFHQSELVEESEVADIANGKLVFFEIVTKELERGPRLDASNAFLAWPAQLQDYLLALSNREWDSISKSTSHPFKSALLKALEALQMADASPELLAKLIEVKQRLISKPDKPERTHTVRQPVTQLDQEASPALKEPSADSFLHHLLTANSQEYKLKLFPLLVEGVKAICTDDAFKQAVFLLNFNEKLAENQIPNLEINFYSLANRQYRFQFWLQGVVPYCDTEVLIEQFSKGSDNIKQQIIQHLPEIANLATPANAISQPIINSYFNNIKNQIIASLLDAQQNICVAVAWFTHDELFTVLCEKINQGIKVELIINNDYINNWEFGLPFSEFIALGGKLYLSEHPAMMHHKFCLIDETTLFTGSYNWTYYAELRNEENILRISGSSETVTSFKTEFEHLKQRLGNPVTSIIPFPAEELGRFERIGFREYLSKDIHSRVAYTQKTRPTADPQRLAALLNQAIKIDERNEDARQLLQDVVPAAVLDNYAIRAQEAVRQPLVSVATQQPESQVSPHPALPTTATPVLKSTIAVPAHPSDIALPVQQPVAKPIVRPVPTAPVASLGQLPTISVSQPTATVSAPSPPASSSSARHLVSGPATAPPIQPQQSINTNISIPDTQRTSALFKNLQIVLALDYSQSMEDTYKLYSTGKIQQVINMVFGVAKGLVASEQIDMFLFEQKAIPLLGITEKNYASYVENVVKKYSMAGTNIHAPIKAIHEKYANTLNNKEFFFVILITDGENSNIADNAKIKDYFANNSETPIFWQFVGLGTKFAFLEDIADKVDNAAFFKLNDVQSVSNDTLLERLLLKFPKWIEQKASSII